MIPALIASQSQGATTAGLVQ